MRTTLQASITSASTASPRRSVTTKKPRSNVDVYSYTCVLSASDDYFCEANDRAIIFNDLIVRGTLDGSTTVIFDEERDNPTVKLHISYLATGP